MARTSTTAGAVLLLAAATLAGASVAPVEPSYASDADSCVMTGDNSAAFSSAPKPEKEIDEWFAHCNSWAPPGISLEHEDKACNRAAQNAVWQADHAEAEAAPPEELVPYEVYINMPEEKTWVCPLDSVEEAAGGANTNMINPNGGMGQTGHPTRWVVHNRASTPIIITHLNALGLEVSAADLATYPAHSNTAVYPDGPVVLPGKMAVVEGRQGQTFVAREYREMLPIDAMTAEGDQPSWNSFKGVLPNTLSGGGQSRYETNKGIMHVLGNPGRVLMKHRMGNIYVRNEGGAVCPANAGSGTEDETNKNAGRGGTPKDMNPLCNVLRKAFVNKVGCPIDIYYTGHPKTEGYNCEKFQKHLGSLEAFLSKAPADRDIDGASSPLKFENTYNGHHFVARMAHDHSFVARIEIEHDVVRDCPEPTKSKAAAKVRVAEAIVAEVPVGVGNATESVHAASHVWIAGVKANATEAPVASAKSRRVKRDLVWPNRTGILSAAVSMAS